MEGKKMEENSSSFNLERNKLNELPCPFTWQECFSKFDEIDWVQRLHDKLSRPNSNDWRIYSLKVLLGCIYGHKKKENAALEVLDWCEEFVQGKCGDCFFKDIMDGMQHVISASKCHVYLQNGKLDRAVDIASHLKPLEDLNKQSQAAVWATKAYILSGFALEGKKRASEYIGYAIELDPDDDGTRKGAWYYFAGKMQAQIRRINSYETLPSDRELKLLERSVKKNPFLVHLVVLADSYREAAKIHYRSSYKNSKQLSEKLGLAALQLYNNTIQKERKNIGVLRRCGAGLMKLPRKHANIVLAEDALIRALQLEPINPFVLLSLGNLEEWYKENFKAALDYYEKAYENSNEMGAMLMIKMRYRLDNNYNPLDDCEKFISNLQNTLSAKERTASYKAIKGEYYLYVKNDLLSAAREWMEAIKIEPDCSALKCHRSLFTKRKDCINVYDVLKREIPKALLLGKFCGEDEVYLRELLKDTSLKENIMNGSQELDSGNNSTEIRDKSINSAINSISNLTLSDKDIDEESTSLTEKKSKLNDLLCPFTWPECSTKFEEIDWIEKLKVKLSRPNCNDWRFFCLNLLLGCIHGHKKQEYDAFEALESCAKLIKEKGHEKFFQGITEGLEYIIAASKCHIYSEIGKHERANDIALTIKSHEDLTKPSRAAILATKSYILNEFGYEGKVKALECAKEAIELDPDKDGTRKGAWYFLAGKLCGQLRRTKSFSEIPSREELKFLERSVENNPFSVHLVVLADSYREAAKVHLRSSHQNRRLCDRLCQAAQAKYREAIQYKDLNVGTLRRCGVGLMKLPKRFRDLSLAEEALQKALTLAPENSTVLLAMGNLEDWHKSNPLAAISYYEKSYNSGNPIGAVYMMKIRYRLDKNYNPLEDCDKYIKDCDNALKSKLTEDRKVSFMVIKGEYYLSVKNDLLAAAKEWEKAIETSPICMSLMEHHYIFNPKFQDINIYNVLGVEILEALRFKKYSGENEVYLRKLLKICQDQKS